MLTTRHAFRTTKTTAVALFLQLAATSGLYVAEAFHNHLDPPAIEWRGHAGDHPGDEQSAHAWE